MFGYAEAITERTNRGNGNRAEVETTSTSEITARGLNITSKLGKNGSLSVDTKRKAIATRKVKKYDNLSTNAYATLNGKINLGASPEGISIIVDELGNVSFTGVDVVNYTTGSNEVYVQSLDIGTALPSLSINATESRGNAEIFSSGMLPRIAITNNSNKDLKIGNFYLSDVNTSYSISDYSNTKGFTYSITTLDAKKKAIEIETTVAGTDITFAGSVNNRNGVLNVTANGGDIHYGNNTTE